MSRLLAPTISLLAVMAGFTLSPAPSPRQSQPEISALSRSEDVVVDRDVMVVMRDGVRLATDIYRPARNGVPVAEPRPILLQRTPYDLRADDIVGIARFFVAHGYVVALQNLRGRYRSEGTFRKYDAAGAPDGYDAIQWLATQPYGNGRIGMWGTSYAAHSQADAAKLSPPGLKLALLNQGGMSNAWDHAVRHGGAFELGRELTWAWEQIKADAPSPAVRAYLENEKVTDWYSALPFRAGLSPLAAAPEFESYFLEEYTRSDYDTFWRHTGVNWIDYYSQTSDIPMLHIGGWYDIFLRGTIENFQRLSELKKSPMYLLVGPWNHHGNARSFTGEVDFGPEAALPGFETDFFLRWFDRFLRDARVEPQAAHVRLFVMGTGDGTRDGHGRLRHGGYWRDAPTWPLPEARVTPFYLSGDGRLTPVPPTSGPASTTFTYDPRSPVPTIGGSVSNRLKDGAYDQRERPEFHGSRPPYLPLRGRQDVIVFQSDPLSEDVTVIGPIEVVLHVSSTAVDTDFTAKLVDVYPPSPDYPAGFDLNISDALVRMRYRDQKQTGELIEPGRVYPVSIRPFPTANVFKKGHRIRLDVSSSNFPRFDPNPNTGESLGKHRRVITADNTIHHSGAYPSRLELSIVSQ